MTEQEQMLTMLLDCNRSDLYLDPKTLTSEQQDRLQHMKARRIKGEPLQYILGDTQFMDLKFHVDSRVLIPRPETEILVELAYNELDAKGTDKQFQILDLGTGSGNITITLAKKLKNAHITAVDVSVNALEVASANAYAHGVEDRITFIEEDMGLYLKGLKMEHAEFDLIVSNPPYIPTGLMTKLPLDVQQEPRIALDGGEDGLDFYRKIFEYGKDLLSIRGFLMCEIGDGLRKPIENLLCESDRYSYVDFEEDYTQTDRIIILK